MELGDVGAQGSQIGPIVEPTHDHENMLVAQVGADVGQLGGVGEEVALLAQVFERVLSESLELVTDSALGRVELLLE